MGVRSPGPAFSGRGLDVGAKTAYPRGELGFAYNVDQAATFAAIRMFYWRQRQVEEGLSRDEAIADLQAVANNMHGEFADRRRVFELAYGMLSALKDWPIGQDALYDVESLQRLGNALVKAHILGQGVPDEVWWNSARRPRYELCEVAWTRYHRIFGDNVP
jgi:hypothetical protein